ALSTQHSALKRTQHPALALGSLRMPHSLIGIRWEVECFFREMFSEVNHEISHGNNARCIPLMIDERDVSIIPLVHQLHSGNHRIFQAQFRRIDGHDLVDWSRITDRLTNDLVEQVTFGEQADEPALFTDQSAPQSLTLHHFNRLADAGAP